MKKSKKWRLPLIIIILALTFYNIFPTLFYYSKPLRSQVNEKMAKNIAHKSIDRILSLEGFSIKWIKSFCNLINVNPNSIKINQDSLEMQVEFTKVEDARKFKKFLPKAGSLINFSPAQLSLSKQEKEGEGKVVFLQRQIPSIEKNINKESLFSFGYKKDDKGLITDFFKEIVFDRTNEIANCIVRSSETGNLVDHILSTNDKKQITSLARQMFDFLDIFPENSEITKRYFNSFLNNFTNDKAKQHESFLAILAEYKKDIKLEKNQDQLGANKSLNKNEDLIYFLEEKLKKNKDLIISDFSELQLNNDGKLFEQVDLKGFNPFIKNIKINWNEEKIYLIFHEDVGAYLNSKASKSDSFNIKKLKVDQLIINEIARISNKVDEQLFPVNNDFFININELNSSRSFLKLDLEQIANKYQKAVISLIEKRWEPKHAELQSDVFPIYDWETYCSLPEKDKQFCLVTYSACLDKTNFSKNDFIKSNSIYIFAKGIGQIFEKYIDNLNSEESKSFKEDFFDNLASTLQSYGFIGYKGNVLSDNKNINDFVFEKENYYQPVLSATREHFVVKGSKKYAILEFSDVEQRMLMDNKVDTAIHEELLKWKDAHNLEKVSIDPNVQYEVPAPVKNVFLSNILLSCKKYLRGDERKIIHWGLDLSGGKSVQIELRDQNNKIVKNESDIKQGINELYNRVNKMGVSEVNIRKAGNNIALDFPGATNLSASELIKASTMFFHVVNEKFTINNKSLADSVNRFLQDIWNEAIVTNKKEIESINLIAYKHLYGEDGNRDSPMPRSDAAKILYENGLRLAHPSNDATDCQFDTNLSKIAIFRNDSVSTKWNEQAYPFLIVFNNYTLEGPDLENIYSSYDPSQGNYLSFGIKKNKSNFSNEKIKPREALCSWTSYFSKEGDLKKNKLDEYNSAGWRMAVILNDSIISSPHLKANLNDKAMISGNFSQREVTQLVSDLKAGSLSFTPKILSEKNISPELGKQERHRGIMSMAIAFIFVAVAMIFYYRFAGVIASIALIFNLLFMWAILQNLNATLTLAGIAGIILTVGMAVDANVLIFERMKEETKAASSLITVIKEGYRKAFSAILDSNITTIIAALILLNFDAGPIKGFAITLIIGIASSMFSALFMTKYFFLNWGKRQATYSKLKMSDFIKGRDFNFLNKSKWLIGFSCFIMIIGGLFLLKNNKTSILGMDFNGGYELNICLDKEGGNDYRKLIEDALVKSGASSMDFQIREMNNKNNLRILFGKNMESLHSPFYGMPLQQSKPNFIYNYENNPRIEWIVTSLEKANLPIAKESLESLETSWTSISGQMSDNMRNNAIVGLLLAFAGIFIYISFRFEFKYAISAMICLFHDVLIAISMICILNRLNVPIQIDLHCIAAIMTIIGYSLNDTIIVFDRIREDLKSFRKSKPFKSIINNALNITFSRTIITSGTTFLVLIPLILFGGNTIFGFSLVMAIGVIFGTMSSIFIAAPLVLFFSRTSKKASVNVKYNFIGEK